MITNLEHLKNAVAMLEEGGWTPMEELRILEGIQTIVTLNMDRIEYETANKFDRIVDRNRVVDALKGA
jgi:hypothetical protein